MTKLLLPAIMAVSGLHGCSLSSAFTVLPSSLSGERPATSEKPNHIRSRFGLLEFAVEGLKASSSPSSFCCSDHLPTAGSKYHASMWLPFLGNQNFTVQVGTPEQAVIFLSMDGKLSLDEVAVSYHTHPETGRITLSYPPSVRRLLQKYQTKLSEPRHMDEIVIDVQPPMKIRSFSIRLHAVAKPTKEPIVATSGACGSEQSKQKESVDHTLRTVSSKKISVSLSPPTQNKTTRHHIPPRTIHPPAIISAAGSLSRHNNPDSFPSPPAFCAWETFQKQGAVALGATGIALVLAAAAAGASVDGLSSSFREE